MTNNINLLIFTLFKYFLITNIIEILISILLGIRKLKNFLCIILINFVTNISINLILLNFNIKTFFKIVLEIIIMIIECYLYYKCFEVEDKFFLKKIPNKKIIFLLYSIIINILSFFIGMLFYNFNI